MDVVPAAVGHHAEVVASSAQRRRRTLRAGTARVPPPGAAPRGRSRPGPPPPRRARAAIATCARSPMPSARRQPLLRHVTGRSSSPRKCANDPRAGQRFGADADVSPSRLARKRSLQPAAALAQVAAEEYQNPEVAVPRPIAVARPPARSPSTRRAPPAGWRAPPPIGFSHGSSLIRPSSAGSARSRRVQAPGRHARSRTVVAPPLAVNCSRPYSRIVSSIAEARFASDPPLPAEQARVDRATRRRRARHPITVAAHRRQPPPHRG